MSDISQIDGNALTPLFYSEISSSYMLYDIFSNHIDIAKDFIKQFFGFDIQTSIHIDREQSYKGKGSIDLFFRFNLNNRNAALLIETKVHDYISATPEQLKTYYNAALQDEEINDVYLIYLTQFNKLNFEKYSENTLVPGTIQEFENASSELSEYRERLVHLSWDQLYNFMECHEERLSTEQKLILELQRKWMKAKCETDLASNSANVGNRGILEYFSDIDIDLLKELPFGTIVTGNNREKLKINLKNCSSLQLDRILEIIRAFSSSGNINTKVRKPAEEQTIQAVKTFLAEMARHESEWKLLSFYAALFDFVNTTGHLFLNGTGTRGFSIIVNIKGKGNISLCTLWSDKSVEFSLKR